MPHITQTRQAIALIKAFVKLIVITNYSPIAQLVEQRTVNPCVPGSSPGWRAIYEEAFIIHLMEVFLWLTFNTVNIAINIALVFF